ncbi:TetR/AcrR family transcriptional regulator, partial [Streptomyces sp. NPDC020667]
PAVAAPAVPAPRGPSGPAPARGTPTPWALADGIRDRTAHAVTADLGRAGQGPGAETVLWACEAAVRLTLSYVLAPAASHEEAAGQVARLVRALLSYGERTTEGERTI